MGPLLSTKINYQQEHVCRSFSSCTEIIYIYLQGKTNSRVDKCVHTLLKITWDKSFEWLNKLSKGKNTRKHTEIQKRHKASLNMDTQNVPYG